MAKVFCFGNTTNGELGLGGIEEHIRLPKKLKLPTHLRRYRVVELSSGRNHTCVLMHNHNNDESVVLTCGSNER